MHEATDGVCFTELVEKREVYDDCQTQVFLGP